MSDNEKRYCSLWLEFAHKSNNADDFSNAVADLACGIGVDYVLDYAYNVARKGKDKELFFKIMNELDKSQFVELFRKVVIREIEGEFTGKALKIMKEEILRCRKEQGLFFDIANGEKFYKNGYHISLLGYSVRTNRFDVAEYLFDLGANNMTYDEMIIEGNGISVDDANRNFVVSFLLKYVIRFIRIMKERELSENCYNRNCVSQSLREFKEGLKKIVRSEQFKQYEKVKLIRDLLNVELKNNYLTDEMVIKNVEDIVTFAWNVLEYDDSDKQKEINGILKEEIESILKLELNNDDLDFKLLKRVLEVAKVTLEKYDFDMMIDLKNDDNFNMLDVVCSRNNINENDKNDYKYVIDFLIRNGLRESQKLDNTNNGSSQLKGYENDKNCNRHVGREELKNLIKIAIDSARIEKLKEYIKMYLNFCKVDCNDTKFASSLVKKLNKEDLFEFRLELHKRGKYALNLPKSIYITLAGNRSQSEGMEISSLIKECSDKLKYIHGVLKEEFKKRDLEDDYNSFIKMMNECRKKRFDDINKYNNGKINVPRERPGLMSLFGIKR